MQAAVVPEQLPEKTNLLGMSRQTLAEFLLDMGEKRFRADQLTKWLYQQGEADFDRMTNLGKSLRARLNEVAMVQVPEVVWEHTSTDGTRKWVIRVAGGSMVETVLIPDGRRGTLCVSSQVGCTLDCSFCSTGKQGFQRNLSSAEIIGQLWVAQQALQSPDYDGEASLTNIVFMGMGEPLLNFDAVVEAIRIMADDFGYGLSKRRITVSTAGVVPMLPKLAEAVDVSLAISLHAADNALRNELVPLNRKYPIEELMSATRAFLERTGARKHVTVEYTLIADVNDSAQHARRLARLLNGLPCKINLIPFNPFEQSDYRRPKTAVVRAFHRQLMDKGYIVTIRSTRGDDISAACGQLVGQVQDRTRRSERYRKIALREVPVTEVPVEGIRPAGG